MKEGDKPPKMSPQDIIEFIFFPVVNEGCRVIAEGIVDKPADLDVATVLSMGFPAYRFALLPLSCRRPLPFSSPSCQIWM
jgi:enoyl-CoA hydratase/3-hydroxyacyl-CoA dehydrogenase